MSQQSQFEEEYRDGPQPAPTYQSGYTGPQPVAYAPPMPVAPRSYANLPGQKLLVHAIPAGQPASTGARLALAIVSMIFVFFMYMATLAIAGSVRFDDSKGIITGLAVLFSLAFTVVVIIINLIFNRKHS